MREGIKTLAFCRHFHDPKADEKMNLFWMRGFSSFFYPEETREVEEGSSAGVAQEMNG